MHDAAAECALCPIVKRVCFWGELTQYAPWKRPILLLISLAFLVGSVAFLYAFGARPEKLWAWGLPAFFSAMSLFGIVVSFWGCNRCVVRLWGDV